MLDKMFFKIVLNTLDTILGALLGAILGISYYLNTENSNAWIGPETAVVILLIYFGISIVIKDTFLRS